MSTLALEAIGLLLKRFDKSKDQKQLHDHIRETLLRELSVNKELVAEARRLAKDDDTKTSDEILRKIRVGSFEAVTATGIPLKSIFPGKWEVTENFPNGAKKKHLGRLREIREVGTLVERTYHRLIIQSIRSEVGQRKRLDSLGYLEQLLYEAPRAIETL